MNVYTVLHSMPSVGNWRKLAYKNGSNRNIIAVLENNFTEACRITKHAARLFEGATDTESAENVWDFLKQNVTYKADGTRSQDIRLPNRLLADGTGDCKSFALFAASILANLGLPVGFRYVSFRASKTPTHVYTIADDEEGNEIIIDAVWKYFNAEHSYTSKQDTSMEVAVMGSIAEGMTVENAARIIGRLREKLQTLPIESGERETIRKHIERLADWLRAQGVGNVWNTVKSVALAPFRNSFLSIVLLNFRALATHLDRAIKKNEGAVKKKWESLGGKWSSLVNDVNKGKVKKPIFGDGSPMEVHVYNNEDFATDTVNLPGSGAWLNAHTKEEGTTWFDKQIADWNAKGNKVLVLKLTSKKNYFLANWPHLADTVTGIGVAPAIPALIAAAASIFAAMAKVIKEVDPDAAKDLDGAIDDIQKAGQAAGMNINLTDPTTVPGYSVSDDESKGFSISSIPIWGWGLGAAAVGYVLFKS